MIVINRAKAEAATRDRLRIERAERFAELDVAFMRGLEVGIDVSAITAKKDALRAVTEKNLSGLSLDELAALTLDEALSL